VSAFELEPYDPSRRDAYLGLLREAWGEGAMSGAVFDWWFAGNPEGSLMSVAAIDGEVVGVAAHSLARLRLGGEEQLAQYSVHAVTSQRARGLGIFRALEHRHEELGKERGSACVLAFASAPTRPLFLGPLGWSQIDRRRVWGRPLTAALARRLRRGAVSPPTVSPDGGRGTVALARFGPEQEAAYEALAPRLGNHVVRSARHLQWRYLDSPRKYAAFASRDGFAVLGSVPRGRLVAGLVLELVAPPGQAGALLSRCAREARGADILLAVPSPLLPRGVLARHGFVPLPTRLDFMGLGLTRPLDARADAWALALGDTDFF
jgi:hypothetical protein